MPGRMNFGYDLTRPRERQASRRRDDSPMRILVMGDFSGRANRGVESHSDLASRSPVAVDVDNFERVMSRLCPHLEVPVMTPGGAAVTLDFAQLDDFHPDALYRRLELFQALRETRRRMQDVSTFEQAAAEFRSEATRRIDEPQASQPHGDTPQADEADTDTFARLMGGNPASAPQPAPQPTQPSLDINAFIRSIVAPHIVPDAPPFQAQYVASVDAATSEQMRLILHDPAFQALEALWRGVHWLVANLELGEQLKLYLLDASKAEVLADVRAAQGTIETSGLYRLLVDAHSRTAGGEPWSVIVGDYAFGPDGPDVGLLACLGSIAGDAGGPFLAAARPAVAGFDSVATMPDPRDWRPAEGEVFAAWNALRESLIAPWIGLTLPRMLLRLPYGRATDPVEAFDFDEAGAVRNHERYLWGNGALACALLIARAFLSRGWDMEPGDELDVEDLPAHTYPEDDEKRLQPCAETNITDRAGQAMLERGVVPLLSYKNRNALRVMRLQSIAEPSQALSGPWN